MVTYYAAKPLYTGGAWVSPGDEVSVAGMDDRQVGRLIREGQIYADAVGSGTYVGVSDANTLWVPASDFVAHAGAPSIDNSFGNGFPAHLMDAASDEQVAGSFMVPSWWTTMDITIVWANASTGSGNVRWRIVYTPNDVGDGMTTGGVAPTGVTSTAGSQYVRVDATMASGVSVSKPLWAVRVWRDADDAADTLANDVGFVGLLVERAS